MYIYKLLQFSLAGMYLTGTGVEKNYVRAYTLYKVSFLNTGSYYIESVIKNLKNLVLTDETSNMLLCIAEVEKFYGFRGLIGTAKHFQ